jgi:hypothetical protein
MKAEGHMSNNERQALYQALLKWWDICRKRHPRTWQERAAHADRLHSLAFGDWGGVA